MQEPLQETFSAAPLHPSILTRLHKLVRGPTEPPRYALTRWLFLRLLGVVYFFAFLSLWMQITGLIGSSGISPVGTFLDNVRASLSNTDLWRVPTLLWINSSNEALNLICGAGVVLSVLVVIDFLTLPALVVMYAFYLSLIYGGQSFLSFQWDILLLEVGFLAIFLAPLNPLPKGPRHGSPSRVVVWLFRLMLFRLMFESGFVKITSGDPTWCDVLSKNPNRCLLTATTFHYWTQPLPSPLAWYMAQLPTNIHQIEVLFTFFVELFIPFLIFGPRRIRFIAAGFILLLQTLILLTGNYTFFNFLTIALCVPLLDDQFLRRFFPRRWRDVPPTESSSGYEPSVQPSLNPTALARQIFFGAIGIYFVILNLTQLGITTQSSIESAFNTGTIVPASLREVVNQERPFFLVNNYGLFATMTTSRPEIVVEGSSDGQTWKAYEFKYKAGDLAREPSWVEPFQPRLDWQMWFAALEGNPNAEGWFPTFAQRLLQGTPEVLALLANNPFPDAPPLYVRAELYDYKFTDAATLAATGDWWQRTPIGEFMPPVSLSNSH